MCQGSANVWFYQGKTKHQADFTSTSGMIQFESLSSAAGGLPLRK